MFFRQRVLLAFRWPAVGRFFFRANGGKGQPLADFYTNAPLLKFTGGFFVSFLIEITKKSILGRKFLGWILVLFIRTRVKEP